MCHFLRAGSIDPGKGEESFDLESSTERRGLSGRWCNSTANVSKEGWMIERKKKRDDDIVVKNWGGR